ncbi:DUF2634 domain-containing protein [Bacillus mobilis]|nr:DUF2634 domain-containing protein [Bacillus mobilis]
MFDSIPKINWNFDETEEQTKSEEITGYLTPLFDYGTCEFVADANGVVTLDDGQQGMANLIEKIHRAQRNAYQVYNDDYGTEARSVLIDHELNEAGKILRLKDAIRESLIYDDRIIDVSVINIERQSDEKDALVAEYTVYTIYGNIPVRREVTE